MQTQKAFDRQAGCVAAAILAAVEGGILPPGKNVRFFNDPRIAG